MEFLNLFRKLKAWMNIGQSYKPETNKPQGRPSHTFIALIQTAKYQIILEQWMQEEKPYMNKDFRLEDIRQVLPLNRSYLSRLFNDIYGETFFAFVMRYRIEESVRLLTGRPDLNMTDIAQHCGFSSASVFGRAFLKNKAMTPRQYRMLYAKQSAQEYDINT